jgi:acyl phosphate:glycerol-3-phosphate acyltransferase
MKHIGRKLYHLLGGLGLLSLYYLLGRPRALICYGIITVVVLAIEITRLRIPAFNQFLFDRFGNFIRKNESNKFTGTVPYVLGIGLSLLFYRTDIATAAICFLAFGDVAATAVGERYGRTKIAGQKSLEGTLAFVAVAVTVGFLLPLAGIHLLFGLVLAGAITAAAAELVPLPINDNLVIPLVSGGIMELIARMTGSA